MDCKTFIDGLDLLLDGRASGAEIDAALDHRRACASCRALWNALERANIREAPEPPADLVASILDRTSGSTCLRARPLLCELVDGRLDGIERALLDGHLAACADCSAIADTLGKISSTLPLLAELDPGPGFVDEVLARTSRRPVRMPAWPSRLAGTWRHWLARPRFAWEAAYVATLAVLLAVGLPAPSLARAPVRAIERAIDDAATRQEWVARWERTGSPEAGVAWRRIGERTRRSLREWRSGVVRRGSPPLERFADNLGTLWQDLASEDTTGRQAADEKPDSRGDDR